MAGGRSDQQSSADWEMTFLIAVGLTVAIVAILWWKASPIFIIPSLAMDWPKLKLLAMLGYATPEDLKLLTRIQGHFDGHYDPWEMNVSEFLRIVDLVGSRTHIQASLFVAALAMIVLFWMKGDGFKRHMNLNHFLQEQTKHWKQSVVSLGINPKNESTPNLEPANTPFRWLHKIGVKAKDGKLTSSEQQECKKALERQLGAHWTGFEELTLSAKCVAMICMTHMTKGRDEALAFRQQIAMTYAYVKDDEKHRKAVEGLIGPYVADKSLMARMEKLAKRNAFVQTVLITLLKESRGKSGVLPTAEFLWLKAVDRDLYYVLNNIGRRAYHLDGAAGVCHWNAEHVGRYPLPEPHVDQALEGLEEYLKRHETDPETVLKDPDADD